MSRVGRLVKRRAALAVFLVCFAGGTTSFWIDKRQSNERVADGRRRDAVVCAFLNDTRAEIRGVIQDGQGATNVRTVIAALPPELQAALRGVLEESATRSAERARRQLERLADYDCQAFIRGEVPTRPVSR